MVWLTKISSSRTNPLAEHAVRRGRVELVSHAPDPLPDRPPAESSVTPANAEPIVNSSNCNYQPDQSTTYKPQ